MIGCTPLVALRSKMATLLRTFQGVGVASRMVTVTASLKFAAIKLAFSPSVAGRAWFPASGWAFSVKPPVATACGSLLAKGKLGGRPQPTRDRFIPLTTVIVAVLEPPGVKVWVPDEPDAMSPPSENPIWLPAATKTVTPGSSPSADPLPDVPISGAIMARPAARALSTAPNCAVPAAVEAKSSSGFVPVAISENRVGAALVATLAQSTGPAKSTLISFAHPPDWPGPTPAAKSAKIEVARRGEGFKALLTNL